MKTLLPISMTLIALAGLAVPATVAMACSCMPLLPPVEAMDGADAVFTGRVLSAGNCMRTREIEFAGEDLDALGSPLTVKDMVASVGAIKARYE